MLRRVSVKEPCPICGRTHWCYVGDRGVFCTRVPSPRPTRDEVAYFHPLPAAGRREACRAPSHAVARASRAHPDRLDSVYRGLLEALALEPSHLEALLARGLSGEAVRRAGFRSLPPHGRGRVVEAVLRRAGEPEGVPGFYRRDGRWALAGEPGLLIPVRDVEGRIVGCQIRRERAEGGRYRWLSSAGRPDGVGSGVPCHVARGGGGRRVVVTEGPLKSEVVAEKWGVTVVGVAGVNVWRSALPLFYRLGAREIVVAFDADWRENPLVRRERGRLVGALVRNGYRVWLAEWPAEAGKGLDDVLAAGHAARVRLVRVRGRSRSAGGARRRSPGSFVGEVDAARPGGARAERS